MHDAAYRCEARSVRGFIQQLAVQYVPHGYWFYVTGWVPAGKDPARVDDKLITRYDIAVSKWTRARRRRAGLASLQYLRHGRLFVLLATHGEHRFFEVEASQVRDLRRVPLKAFGYAVSSRRGRACVRIERQTFRQLQEQFGELARFGTTEQIAAAFASLPYEPYAPIHQQLRCLWRMINSHRRLAGRQPVPSDVVPWRRRIVRPFDPAVEVTVTPTRALAEVCLENTPTRVDNERDPRLDHDRTPPCTFTSRGG